MNRVNLRRGVKYFAMLCVLYACIMVLLYALGQSAVPADQLAWVLFHTWRGALLAGMAAILAATYPYFGFTRRTVAGDIDEHRGQIVNVFVSAGFMLTDESDGRMTFRAGSAMRRLRLLYEDEIEVVRGMGSEAGNIVIDGIRRVAVPVAFRLEAAVRHSKLQ